MKRIITLILAFSLLFSGCSQKTDIKESGGLKIVTTIFPLYDFARQIAGDKAEVTMLLKPGVESHSFDPAPNDILSIEKSDLFIYIGGESDNWADKLVNSSANDDLRAVSLIDKIDAACGRGSGEILLENHEHDHEHEEVHDEHIWTSPVLAMEICGIIFNEMAKADSENADYYEQNANSLINEIKKLDSEIREVVNDSEKKTLVFGDRFPLTYFADCYDLTYFAAFSGCSAHTEPTAKMMVELIEKVKKENISVVYHIEFSNKKVAQAIADETGCEIMLFHSCHNVTEEELKSGVTYVSLMKQNVLALRHGLSQ